MIHDGFSIPWGNIVGKGNYSIVQFSGPIHPSDRTAIEQAGAVILDYVPEFSFVVRADPALKPTLLAIPGVVSVESYRPEYRVPDGVVPWGSSKKMDETNLVVSIFPNEDLDRIRQAVEKLGGTIREETTNSWGTKLLLKASDDAILDLSTIEGVKWIEPAPEWSLFNNVTCQLVGGRPYINKMELFGGGQVVAVADTGIDRGSTDPDFLNDDFEDGWGSSRVIGIEDVAGDGDSSDRIGHGTHVAGSVAGNGILSGVAAEWGDIEGTSLAGMAPRAKLYFQALYNNEDGGLAVPLNISTLFQSAKVHGARIHINSWGAPDSSQYTSYCRDVDEFLWDNKDYLVFFAAGNEGSDRNGDGLVDPYSLTAPSTAKNVFTVGATEGERPVGSGGLDRTWGDIWPVIYPSDPIRDDYISGDPTKVAAFSSRGPCIDGRVKPDMVAPGTNILSVRSSVAGGSHFWKTFNSNYAWLGGSSMATPIVAGAAALIREYLVKDRGFETPSSALIKAALLDAATIETLQLDTDTQSDTQIQADGEESSDTELVDDAETPDDAPDETATGTHKSAPSFSVGWGILDLESAYLQENRRILFYDETAGIGTGEYLEYPFDVLSEDQPLKAHLVWTDYPGSLQSAGGLVNDLDFEIIAPDGTHYYPDNANPQSIVEVLKYDSGAAIHFNQSNKIAIKLKPTTYPAALDAVGFMFYNPYKLSSKVDIVIYSDDELGGKPGTELFRTTLNYVDHMRWITIPVRDVVIDWGSFYAAVEKTDESEDFGVVVEGKITRRGYYRTGSEPWAVLRETPLIRAYVRGPDQDTPYDRVNNAVGITVWDPQPGAWTARVSGYNVPWPPQPFGMAISGDVTDPTQPTAWGQAPKESGSDGNIPSETVSDDVTEPALPSSPASEIETPEGTGANGDAPPDGEVETSDTAESNEDTPSDTDERPAEETGPNPDLPPEVAKIIQG